MLGVVLLSAARPSLCRRTSGGAPAPSGQEVLRAEAYVVAPTPVRETVRTIGTLAANESVSVVSELSRRLVAVHVAEGTEVEAGTLLFKLDDADLQAQLAELEARRRMAERTEGRQEALLAYDRKALSQQAFDQAQADLQAVEAQMAALRVTLAKTEIRAPFHARVGLRRVSEGAWITPETPLITLQDTSRIKIDFTLPERYAGAIGIGQHRDRLGGDRIGSELVLNELRHDPRAGNQIDHREGVDVDEPPAQPVLERRYTIHDHHRGPVECGLNGCRSRCRQRDVGGPEHGIGLSFDRHHV